VGRKETLGGLDVEEVRKRGRGEMGRERRERY
jgi:hypothetical protein